MIQKQKKHGENIFSFSKTNPSANSKNLLKSNRRNTVGKKADLKNIYGTRKNRFSPLSTTSLQATPKQEVVSITYEEIGLFPRSFSRVLDSATRFR